MNKESQNLEFKSSWQDENLKVLSAFANSNGGILVIGKDDKGNTVDIKNPKKLMEDIPNKVKNKLGIIPFVSIKKEGRKDIIQIGVKPVLHPVPYEGKFYIRSGSTVQEISGTELIRFLLSKSGQTWDFLPSNADIKEVDEDTFEKFIKLAKKRLPEISDKDKAQKILKNLELITGKKLTNAAVLLFAQKPQRYIINAGARVGRFKTDIKIEDTVEAFGNLFQQLSNIFDGVKKHLNVRFEIEDVAREDIWDYPLEALREAIINALIHRDYLSTAEIQIKIYDDRIKIWNPGGLPPEISVEDLKKEHESVPRNKLLAYVFYYAGFIEKWGSGTKRIVELCKLNGLPEPMFKEERGGFSVYFYKDIYTESYLSKQGLNERQIRAVMYVKKQGRITNAVFQEICETSQRTATRDLSNLTDKKIFKKIGKTGKGTEYILRGHKEDKEATKKP